MPHDGGPTPCLSNNKKGINMLKNTMIALGFLIGSAAMPAHGFNGSALSFGPEPVNYEASIIDYVESRMVNPRGARIKTLGEPYQIYAHMTGHEDAACWAVDVMVKSRLPGGGYGRALKYTVILMNGNPVALSDDLKHKVKRA